MASCRKCLKGRKLSKVKIFQKVNMLEKDRHAYGLLNKSNFMFYYSFQKIGDDMNSFLTCCSQFATQLETALKEEQNVCILYIRPSIKYQTCTGC